MSAEKNKIQKATSPDEKAQHAAETGDLGTIVSLLEEEKIGWS